MQAPCRFISGLVLHNTWCRRLSDALNGSVTRDQCLQYHALFREIHCIRYNYQTADEAAGNCKSLIMGNNPWQTHRMECAYASGHLFLARNMFLFIFHISYKLNSVGINLTDVSVRGLWLTDVTYQNP